MTPADFANAMTIKENLRRALDEFQLETQQPSGKIVQTFKFTKNRMGNDVLLYSEQNIFENNRNQTNFMFMGMMYKFFYNRGVRKRMQYLDNLAQNQTA